MGTPYWDYQLESASLLVHGVDINQCVADNLDEGKRYMQTQ